jgi:glutamate/tyrosine decarboxylase-like PLP-dependent enzyme
MREVPCDRKTGKMNLSYLQEMVEKEIEKGNKPFFVNSTAGSTVMGSFDNHHDVSEICKKYGMWHHIDACWGGFLAFSEKYR